MLRFVIPNPNINYTTDEELNGELGYFMYRIYNKDMM